VKGGRTAQWEECFAGRGISRIRNMDIVGVQCMDDSRLGR